MLFSSFLMATPFSSSAEAILFIPGVVEDEDDEKLVLELELEIELELEMEPLDFSGN